MPRKRARSRPPRLTAWSWKMIRAIYRSYGTENELLADPDKRIEELLIALIAELRDVHSLARGVTDGVCKWGALDCIKRNRQKEIEFYLQHEPVKWRDFIYPVTTDFGLPKVSSDGYLLYPTRRKKR